MTKFKGILMSRKLADSDKLYAPATPASDQWVNRPFGSMSSHVTSSTVSPDRREGQCNPSHEDPESRDSEEDHCSTSPVMDLSTTVTDLRSHGHDGYDNRTRSDVLAMAEHKVPSSSPSHLSAHFRAQESEWESRAASLTKQTDALHDCQEDPSSLHSASECSSLSMSNEPMSPSDGSSRKRKRRPQPIPEDCKDDAYWERRKRNNESAKRSREMRRMKEQQTTMRVIYLEQDNLRLKTEVDMLRTELEKVREILYSRSGNFH